MKVLVLLWSFLSCFVGISIEQCTTEQLRDILKVKLGSPSEVTPICLYYNCLSPIIPTNIGPQYSSMSVSVYYGQKQTSYNARCINGSWETVENQSTALGDNNLRYCDDCNDQTNNCTG